MPNLRALIVSLGGDPDDPTSRVGQLVRQLAAQGWSEGQISAEVALQTGARKRPAAAESRPGFAPARETPGRRAPTTRERLQAETRNIDPANVPSAITASAFLPEVGKNVASAARSVGGFLGGLFGGSGAEAREPAPAGGFVSGVERRRRPTTLPRFTISRGGNLRVDEPRRRTMRDVFGGR